MKENGAIFSHANPWAWCAEAALGRGSRAMKFYRALCPAAQNDKIEIRQSEPYSYCQFVMGPDHTAFGRARHPFMTGSGGWSYFAATRYILGVYHITVENPRGVEKGVAAVTCDGRAVQGLIPACAAGTSHQVTVTMG